MSAGAFLTNAKYEADDGKIFSVRVQPETVAATLGGEDNSVPSGAITGGLPSAQVGAGRKTIGVHCRGVRVRFSSTVPTGYKPGGITFIPVMTKTVYDGLSRGSTGTYLGNTIEIVGKVPEIIR